MAVQIDPDGRRLTVPGLDGRPLAMHPSAALVRITSRGGAVATFLPSVGFNLVDWRVPGSRGDVPLIHSEYDVLSGGSGTRSGIPILFPFPNRVAGAQYSFRGRTYRLTPAGPDDPNALHGFCAKTAWNSYEATGDQEVTATFRLSRDASNRLGEWPGDLELSMTYRLTDTDLQVTARVSNPDDRPVPFGFGLHPYFTSLGAELASIDTLQLWCPAQRFWVLDGLIPTGQQLDVGPGNDLRQGGPIGHRVLDDVLTALPDPPMPAGSSGSGLDQEDRPGERPPHGRVEQRSRPQEPYAHGGLEQRARLSGPTAHVQLWCDPAFREVVVYTPADRRSIAVEPYTCATDAVNLTARGVAAGLRVLEPGEKWTGRVELRCLPA